MKKLLSILLTLISLSAFGQQTMTPREIVLFPKDSSAVIANKANTYNGGRATIFYDAVTGQIKVGYGNALHALATKSFVWNLLGGGVISNVVGTSNKIDVSGSSTKTLTISPSYIGQSSITTTGTLTSGSTGSGFTLGLGTSTLSGRIAYANFPQGSALSILGVTGNSTADYAPIAAGSDGAVLRRSGTTLGFGALSLSNTNSVTGILGFANGGLGINTLGAAGDMVKVNVGGTAYQSFDPSISLGISTTGTDVNWGVSSVDPGGSVTLNIPTASSLNRGALSAADWTTFNSKISAVSLATGTSGTDVNVSGSPSAALTLNIPDAGPSARGLMTTGTQTIPGAKTFSGGITSGTSSDGVSLASNSGLITFRNSATTTTLGFSTSNNFLYTTLAWQAPSFRFTTSGNTTDTNASIIFGTGGATTHNSRFANNAGQTGYTSGTSTLSAWGAFNYIQHSIQNNNKPFDVSTGTSSLTALDVSNNIATTGGTNTVTGIRYSPTETSMTGVTHYGLIINSSTARSGFGTATPTARLQVAAGTTNIAPLKLTSGSLLTTPETGAIEYDGTHYYGTIGSTRYQLDQQGGGGGGSWGSITGTLSSQTDLQTALDAKANEALTQNSQTGSNYTLVLTDKDSKYIYMNSASAQTLTIPPNSSVAFPLGTVITAFQIGAGPLSFVAGSGAVTLSSTSGLMTTQQYAPVSLLKVATDTWIVCNGSPGTIITNTAANNELPKSNGSNIVPSGIFSSSAGDVALGTGLSGATRNINFDGSATNVGGTIAAKGTGSITLTGNSKNVYIGASEALNVGGNLIVGGLSTSFNGIPYGMYFRNGNTTPSAAPATGTYIYVKGATSSAELYAMNEAGVETRLTGNSGTYTPTLTNVTNVASSTAYNTKWYRVGDMITVFGKISIDVTTAASTQTEIAISLPVASAMTAEEDLGGTAASDIVAGASVRIRADATNDRAALVFKASSTTNDNYAFQFSYQVK